jgi:transcriptional regulator with XRE-family HTH domain
MTTKRDAGNALAFLEKKFGKLTLAQVIWSIRTADNVSQAAFAKTLGISKQHLYGIEHGKPVSPQLAAKYARILKHSETLFIKLALQDQLDRAGLNMNVEIKLNSKRKRDDQAA